MTQEHLDHILDIRKKAYKCREAAREYRAKIENCKKILESVGGWNISFYDIVREDSEEADRLKKVICHAAIDMLKTLAEEKENDAKELDKIFEKL